MRKDGDDSMTTFNTRNGGGDYDSDNGIDKVMFVSIVMYPKYW